MSRESEFFECPRSGNHRRYEALRVFYCDKLPAKDTAARFGYTVSSFYSMTRDFKKQLRDEQAGASFFSSKSPGRKPKLEKNTIDAEIIALRKQYLPVSEIKTILDAREFQTSEPYIYAVIRREGFARLPQRDRKTKAVTDSRLKISAPTARLLAEETDRFSTSSSGLLCFLPYLRRLGIDVVIEGSDYPATKTIPRLNSILCFLALKLSNFERYTKDDLWCMDRGLGLFAGLNVLPKAAWFSSYSHRVTADMNLAFLRNMTQIWKQNELLSDTANLDFTAIPYWGEGTHLENNWSGKRNQSLSSILAALAHDPESGIITYGDAGVRHDTASDVILEFLDFYSENSGSDLKYLVFDSKFTTYENLAKLDDSDVKFVTIRRRGKKIVEELDNIDSSEWKTVRVTAGDGRKRSLKVLDQTVTLKNYGKPLRQIAIRGNGRIKPALIITNDFDLKKQAIIRKYARRWLVEKTISESIYFFHLNKVSSSMVIKVDFDLTMTILAYNLYRLFAGDLEGYRPNSATTLYDRFISNSGTVDIGQNNISINLKKKRNLPLLLTAMKKFEPITIPWIFNKEISYSGATNS